MKKLVLLVPTIACINQSIVEAKLTVNAGDLVNDNYKMVIINTGKITTRTLNYLHAPSNYTFETLSPEEKKVTKAWFRYKGAKEFNKYVKMEFDTAHADKIILKKVAGIDDSSPAMPTEVDLTIPGLMYGKQVEIGSECFKDLAKHNLFLNIKFHEENGIKVKFNPDCSQMFANTTGRESSIQNIDFSGADTSKVTNMSTMFRGCYSLTSLNLSNFDTSNVTDMSWMFICCDNLRTLDLKNFNTTNVTDMSRMFELCENLTSLDVSRFNTANVKDMRSMFSRCSNLATLDVSNFDTKNVTNMRYMFHDCKSLTSLDLSKFNTKNVTNMDSMFDGCSSLTFLNVRGFDISNVIIRGNMVIVGRWPIVNMWWHDLFRGCLNLINKESLPIRFDSIPQIWPYTFGPEPRVILYDFETAERMKYL